MTYLLDTNAWIEFLRHGQSLIVARIRARQPPDIRTCAVVRAELRYGCVCSARPIENHAKVDAMLRPYVSLPFDDIAADQQATIRRQLDVAGTPIGTYDLQIAAIALAHSCTLLTHNTREFTRVPGLMLDDWQLP